MDACKLMKTVMELYVALPLLLHVSLLQTLIRSDRNHYHSELIDPATYDRRR